MHKYYPIFLSKKGELDGLHHLSEDIKTDVCPVIQVILKSVYNSKKDRKTKIVSTAYDIKFERYFTTHWKGHQVIFDFSCFESLGENVKYINRLLLNLINGGVNVVLSVQSDSVIEYKELVKRLIAEKKCKLCIRSSGVIGFSNTVESILSEMGTRAANTILLIDLRFVGKSDYREKASLAYYAIKSLPSIKNWMDIVIAAGSFPKDLSDFNVGAHRITRYEWLAWGLVADEFSNVKYGDYGTRNPDYEETNHSGTISARYTLKEDFLVLRGQKTDKNPDGHGQYIKHAKTIVEHPEYSGSNFSHGDLLIEEKSKQEISDDERKTGSPTTWVQISLNHNVTLIHSLL